MKIYLPYCKSNCNDFDLYLFYAGDLCLIYAGKGFQLYSYYAGPMNNIVFFLCRRPVSDLRRYELQLYLFYAGLMIDIVLFYANDLYLIYAGMKLQPFFKNKPKPKSGIVLEIGLFRSPQKCVSDHREELHFCRPICIRRFFIFLWVVNGNFSD